MGTSTSIGNLRVVSLKGGRKIEGINIERSQTAGTAILQLLLIPGNHDNCIRNLFQSNRGKFLDFIRLKVCGGSGGQGYPKYGGLGGQGGSVYLEGQQRATLRRLYEEKKDMSNKVYKGGTGLNSR